MIPPRAGGGGSRRPPPCLLVLVSFCICHVAAADSLGQEAGLNPDAHPGNPWAEFTAGGDSAKTSGLTSLLEEKVARLMLWLRENGARGVGGHGDANVKVSLFDSSILPHTFTTKNGRQLSDRPELGLLTSRQIFSGEPILSLPRTLWVSDRHVAHQGLARQPRLSTTVILALWLLRHRYPPPSPSETGSGFWTPYIELLPQSSPQPVGWGEESLVEVDYEPVINEVEAGAEALLDQFLALEPQDFGFRNQAEFEAADIQVADWLWAVGVVRSRCLLLHGPGKGEGDGEGVGGEEGEGLPSSSSSSSSSCFLLPLIDLLNHDCHPNAKVELDPTADSITVTALQHIPPHTPLSISYGSYDSAWFLIEYGFFPPFNPSDFILLFPDLKSILEDWTRSHPSPAHPHSHPGGFSGGGWTNPQKRRLQLVAMKAVKKVEGRVASGEAAKSPGFGVGVGGVVDPRLLAALGAINAASVVQEDTGGDDVIDFDMLADISIDFGRNLSGVTCTELEALAPLPLAAAFRAAIEAVHDAIASGIRMFRNTLADDEDILKDGSDRVAGQRLGRDMETAIKFRLSRKRLLYNVVERIGSACDIASIDPYEGDYYEEEEYYGEGDLDSNTTDLYYNEFEYE